MHTTVRLWRSEHPRDISLISSPLVGRGGMRARNASACPAYCYRNRFPLPKRLRRFYSAIHAFPPPRLSSGNPQRPRFPFAHDCVSFLNVCTDIRSHPARLPLLYYSRIPRTCSPSLPASPRLVQRSVIFQIPSRTLARAPSSAPHSFNVHPCILRIDTPRMPRWLLHPGHHGVMDMISSLVCARRARRSWKHSSPVWSAAGTLAEEPAVFPRPARPILAD